MSQVAALFSLLAITIVYQNAKANICAKTQGYSTGFVILPPLDRQTCNFIAMNYVAAGTYFNLLPFCGSQGKKNMTYKYWDLDFASNCARLRTGLSPIELNKMSSVNGPEARKISCMGPAAGRSCFIRDEPPRKPSSDGNYYYYGASDSTWLALLSGWSDVCINLEIEDSILQLNEWMKNPPAKVYLSFRFGASFSERDIAKYKPTIETMFDDSSSQKASKKINLFLDVLKTLTVMRADARVDASIDLAQLRNIPSKYPELMGRDARDFLSIPQMMVGREVSSYIYSYAHKGNNPFRCMAKLIISTKPIN